MDKLYDKFTVYVETVHHMRFVTKDSPHYEFLKHRVASTQEGNLTAPSIKRELKVTNVSESTTDGAPSGITPENPFNVDEDRSA